MAQAVENLPAVRETQETWAGSLGRDGPLEKGMTTHSSIRAWRIPWTEEPGELLSMGLQRVKHAQAQACTHMIYSQDCLPSSAGSSASAPRETGGQLVPPHRDSLSSSAT